MSRKLVWIELKRFSGFWLFRMRDGEFISFRTCS